MWKNTILRELDLFIAWWTWNLGNTMKQHFDWRVKEILLWWRWVWLDYTIWELSYDNSSNKAVWIVATTAQWLELSLKDFSNNSIPAIVATTWINIRELLATTNVNIPIISASNLALPIVALNNLFENNDFNWTRMEVHESHQNTKKDPSWTAKTIISLYKNNGWNCIIENEENYNQDWISELWDLYCYRWETSVESFWVPREYLWWHGVHKFVISLTWNEEDEIRNFWILKEEFEKWHDLYSNMQIDWIKFEPIIIDDDKITICEHVYWRKVYAAWAESLIPDLLEANPWIYTPNQFLKTVA